jgi:hypothetical protein
MWSKIKAFFAYSETIFWARLHVFVGIVLGVALSLDTSLFQNAIPAKYWPLFLIGWGVLTEYARRRNDPSLGKDN